MTARTAPAPPGRTVRELIRAGLAPLACAAVLIALLSGWVLAGGAGTVSRVRVEVTLAAIPRPSFTAASPAGHTAVAAYLVIRNLSGQADELTSARCAAAAQVRLSRHGVDGPVAAGIAVAAHSRLILSPFGTDLVLIGLRSLQTGQNVPLILTFRQAGPVTADATVTPPGTP